MTKHDEEILARLTQIAYKDLDFFAEYNKILSESTNRLMSKGACLYGMFYPEPELSKYFIYKGKLTKNERKRDFLYHFDNQKRLRLTERFDVNGELLDYIYYFYYEQYIEIVWFDLKEKIVGTVGFIDYENGKIVRFVEAFAALMSVRNKTTIKTYKEYDFSKDEEYVVETSFSNEMYSDGRELVFESKMRKK